MSRETTTTPEVRDLTAALQPLASTPVLLIALDFDGTLAPLIDEPMAARSALSRRAGPARPSGHLGAGGEGPLSRGRAAVWASEGAA